MQAGAKGLVVASPGDQNTGILRTSLHANCIDVLPFDHSDYDKQQGEVASLLPQVIRLLAFK